MPVRMAGHEFGLSDDRLERTQAAIIGSRWASVARFLEIFGRSPKQKAKSRSQTITVVGIRFEEPLQKLPNHCCTLENSTANVFSKLLPIAARPFH